MSNTCTETEYRAIMAEIDTLMDAKVGTPEADRLLKLVATARAYEAVHFVVVAPTPAEAAKFRREQEVGD